MTQQEVWKNHTPHRSYRESLIDSISETEAILFTRTPAERAMAAVAYERKLTNVLRVKHNIIAQAVVRFDPNRGPYTHVEYVNLAHLVRPSIAFRTIVPVDEAVAAVLEAR